MAFKFIFSFVITICIGINISFAQNNPTIHPKALFSDANGQEEETYPANSFSGSAPINGSFSANPKDAEGWSADYEWRFYNKNNTQTPYLVRFEQDTEYTFNRAGQHSIVCYATFTKGSDKITYTKEFWDETGPIVLTISESKLEMPNAFSPNGDGINDIYKAKSGYQSIIEFHAYIFNRWGQKLYEWSDPAGGWDGTYKGGPVKQGTYFCLVNAKGADGSEFNIKRDVNLLRGYIENKP